MITDKERRTLEPIARDLASAAFTQRDTVAALFEAYIKASRAVTGRPGTADPEAIQMGLIASSLGLATLCDWLQEAGRVLDARYWNMSVEHLDWLTRKLGEVGLALPSRSKL